MTVELRGKVIQNHTKLETEIILPVLVRAQVFQCTVVVHVIRTFNKPLVFYIYINYSKTSLTWTTWV
jgi:hypothetical protein